MEERVDLRVIKTREAIEGALVRLLLGKPFERVTVQDILDEARVNRKTFYKHYADKYALADLLIERQRDLFAAALEERFAVDERESAFPAALRKFYQKMHDNRDALLALLDVRTERYTFRDEIEAALKSAYCKRFAGDDTLGIDEMTLDYLSDSFAATTLSSVRWFLETDDKRALDVIENVALRRNDSPAYGFMGLSMP